MVYRFTLDGTFTALARLSGCTSAYSTFLTQGKDGNLYGTTINGGTSGVGTAFRVSTDGVLTTLLNFDRSNGALPSGPLTFGLDGNLYGATMYGGVFEGTVFKMTTGGLLSTLADFTARSAGVRPYGGVIFGADGNLYGTTVTGGTSDRGTIFRVVLPPDTDADGVPDSVDECGDTAPGAIINEHGCSIDQLVPCLGWSNRGQYLSAVAAHLTDFVSEGLLTPDQARDAFTTAAQSDCGKKH